MGLDQDITQRFLACPMRKTGARGLICLGAGVDPGRRAVPGDRLAAPHLLRPARPDGQRAGTAARRRSSGEKITIFIHYILTQIPPGVRGFVAVGVLAAAAVNSALISMSSVLIQDFYRPWARAARPGAGGPLCPRRPRRHGRRSALAMLAMSVLCFYWQRYTDAPLLEFALGGDDLRLFRAARRLFHRCCSRRAARPRR